MFILSTIDGIYDTVHIVVQSRSSSHFPGEFSAEQEEDHGEAPESSLIHWLARSPCIMYLKFDL